MEHRRHVHGRLYHSSRLVGTVCRRDEAPGAQHPLRVHFSKRTRDRAVAAAACVPRPPSENVRRGRRNFRSIPPYPLPGHPSTPRRLPAPVGCAAALPRAVPDAFSSVEGSGSAVRLDLPPFAVRGKESSTTKLDGTMGSGKSCRQRRAKSSQSPTSFRAWERHRQPGAYLRA